MAIAAIVASSCFAQDTILLHNGDILTGEILRQNPDSVYFKSPAFGSVSVSAKDIAEIRIDADTLGEVSIPADAITTNQGAASAEPVAEPKKEEAATSPDAANKPWSGQAGLAIALRESNILRRSGDTLVERNEEYESYRVYGNVDWKGDRNNLRWEWTYRYSRNDTQKNDDFFNVSQNYQHDFSKKYFGGVRTVYQRDFRRGIDNEYLQTAEVGVKWINKPTLKLTVSSGGGYHQYDRIEDEYSDANGKFVLDESLRWQLMEPLALFQEYKHLGNLENYHFVFTSGMENKLVQDLFLRLEYRLDRDTEVNYNDNGYYDKAFLTSLLYKF